MTAPAPAPAAPAARPLTPGAYLKARRTAAGLAVADVAARLATVPHQAEHERVQWLMLIEADAAPMMLTTIVALRHIYSFDLIVLAQLESLVQHGTGPVPQLCRICACSDNDACPGPCWWLDDRLCSACAAEDVAP